MAAGPGLAERLDVAVVVATLGVGALSSRLVGQAFVSRPW
jgi:hypothetical protein